MPPATATRAREGKRGELTRGALTDEAFASSPSVLRLARTGEVNGLQQYYTPPEAAELIADVNGRRRSTLDLTAGNGALLTPLERNLRFGIEIDPGEVAAGRFTSIQGDVQKAYPLLRLVGAEFPRVVCNPPFGMDWTAPNGKVENSTVATWRMALALLASDGMGAFIAGRDRFSELVLSRPDAAGVYALVECPDFFDDIRLATVLAFFVHPERHHPDAGEPLRLVATRDELPNLAPQIVDDRAGRGIYFYDPPNCSARHKLEGDFKAIDAELARRRDELRAARQKYDLALVGGRVSSKPSPFCHLALVKRRVVRDVMRLDRLPASYFFLNAREWRQLLALEDDEVLTIDPALKRAVDAAIAEGERAVCPLYHVRPQQRLAFLDDLDSILCTASDPVRGFVAGKRYDLETSSDIEVTETERPHFGKEGKVELRRYEMEAKVLRIQIGEHVFNESAADVDYLLAHFEIPDPGDIATRFPEEVAKARDLLFDLAEEYGFEFKTRIAGPGERIPEGELDEWQCEDLARLITKGSGILGWEQGGGKSLGGATLIHACWERGAARKGLIVCPQDLIPQWKRELKRFYGVEPEHITSPLQARRIARYLKRGGEGLYITHFEVVSLLGRVDEPLPVQVVKVASTADRKAVVLDSTEFCPGCQAGVHEGWQTKVELVCEACGYVHKRLKVKTAGHYLSQAFHDGVIVVDEGTLAKGNESLRSKAIRGLRCRHPFLMTGTPVSNYVNDVFWLLWWALGEATLRFPFSYHGGRAKFEADFCVIEHHLSKGRREGRKVLPKVTNVSRFWRLMAGAMVRRRKFDMGELPPRTIRTIAAPMGVAQRELYAFWLDKGNFRRFFAHKHPGHKMLEANLVELFAAGLGQLTKLEYATTLPEADPDKSWIGLDEMTLSNWTPKNLQVLQTAIEHVERGEKVLLGSDLIETGKWFAERLREKGVRAAHIVEERNGKSQTMNPRKRAKAIEQFKHGDTQVLCCGIPSIRLGHSLETASCVIVTGLVFSYEMFDQFIARAWRLNSPGPVTVYIAMALASLDPKKWDLLCKKAQAADLALDGELIDQAEEPVSLEQVLKDLRKQGVAPTGDEIPETDIEAAWHATPRLKLVTPAFVAENVVPLQPLQSAEQLDLFAAA